MLKTSRSDPLFIADDCALDFLNSIATPSAETIEWINDGHDLLVWLEQAHLIPTEIAKTFRKETSPEALNEIAEQARALRKWFRKFIIANAGRQLDSAALAELTKLNRLLARDAYYYQIEADLTDKHLPLKMQQHQRWKTPEDLLLPIARAMSELICRIDFKRVKPCEGSACTMWFLDASKNHTRRWCVMEICGNRAKAAAHRAKKKLS